MFFICQKILIICTILVLFTKNATTISSQNWQQQFEITRNLSEALVEIVGAVFVDSFHSKVLNFQLKMRNKNKKHLHEFQKIIDETLSLMNDSIAIHLKNGLSVPPDNQRHFCVLLVDSSESLQFLYKDLNKFHLFVEGSYYIVLQTFPHVHHYYDELFEIFQLNWLNGITHADVLIHAAHNAILLFHSMPFTPFHCKGVAPIIHNKFIDGRWLHTNFVIPKSNNLYGCPLVCATWEDMPYFQIDRDHTEGKAKYLGLEGKLLEYLAAKMNFTITMRWLNEEEIGQTLYDEQGVFNKLFTTNTDFVIGAFHYKPTSLEDPYAPTTSYYMSNYFFIVSSKTDAYSSFTKLLLPFDTIIWIILIFLFVFGNIVAFLVIYLDRKLRALVLGRENETPAYNMIVISLGGAVAKDPKVPFSRFLLMVWLLTTFVLRTAYQGYMFHFIKSDLHTPPPKLISDLMHQDYRILMSDVVFSTLTDLPNLFSKAEILNKTELQAFDMLRHPKNYEPYKLAILTAHEYYGYYKFITPINYDFFIVPEKLFTQQLSIYMKKNSAYIKRFNMYIKSYLNEGLMNRLERLLFFGGANHRARDDSPRPMKISHLYGAYSLLFAGLTGSLLAFFGEICLYGVKMRIGGKRRKF